MFRSFEIGSLTIHTFGLLVGLGFVAGITLAARRARAVGLDPDRMYDLAFPWILVSGLVGARLLYVITFWQQEFAGESWIEPFAIWRGGLVFYGGLALATVVALLRIRWLKLPLWRVTDCLAPGLALGHVFGRLGCLINGCCYGRPSSLPWAISYPRHFGANQKPIYPLDSVHPTQVYEALLNLTLCGALVWIHQRRRFDGQVTAIYLMVYAAIRFFVELFRGDYRVGEVPLLSQPGAAIFTPGQRASFLVLVAGIALYAYCRRTGPPVPRPT